MSFFGRMRRAFGAKRIRADHQYIYNMPEGQRVLAYQMDHAKLLETRVPHDVHGRVDEFGMGILEGRRQMVRDTLEMLAMTEEDALDVAIAVSRDLGGEE